MCEHMHYDFLKYEVEKLQEENKKLREERERIWAEAERSIRIHRQLERLFDELTMIKATDA